MKLCTERIYFDALLMQTEDCKEKSMGFIGYLYVSMSLSLLSTTMDRPFVEVAKDQQDRSAYRQRNADTSIIPRFVCISMPFKLLM